MPERQTQFNAPNTRGSLNKKVKKEQQTMKVAISTTTTTKHNRHNNKATATIGSARSGICQ